MRIAALAELPVSYILTHDSIGVGEDGPTHQPVETVSGLRVLPNMDVMRPADYDETAAAYAHSIAKIDGPTALILTRQNVPQSAAPADVKRQGTLKVRPLNILFIHSLPFDQKEPFKGNEKQTSQPFEGERLNLLRASCALPLRRATPPPHERPRGLGVRTNFYVTDTTVPANAPFSLCRAATCSRKRRRP